MKLSDVAVVGLERAGGAATVEGDLVSRLSGASAEAAFLLRLGVAAVSARAGRRPGQHAAPAPAAAETRPACSEALARVVVDLARERQVDLLREALSRLDERGLRLPAWCLNDLGELDPRPLQPALGRVAGARGRWLAGQHPRWRGLVGSEDGQSAEDRQRAWEEGSLPARLAALRSYRGEAAAGARGWVEAVWKQEKAGVREDLLGVLEQGLGPEDEPFLTRAAADRAAPVRVAAARLLARLPGSALAARMRQRADGMLGFRPSGLLDVTPPPAFPADWAGDGLLEKPPPGTGEKAYWLTQVLSLVPPEHWQQRFAVAPDLLVAAARGGDWFDPVLAGWLAATVLFRAPAWASALWRGYAASAPPAELPALATVLLPLVPPAEAEALVTPLLAGDPAALPPILNALPVPWGEAFATAFLSALARALDTPTPSWQQVQGWRANLERAAIALPPACFARARAQGADPEAPNPLGRALESFHAVLAIRQQVHQETRT
jgi:hypothetical protein